MRMWWGFMRSIMRGRWLLLLLLLLLVVVVVVVVVTEGEGWGFIRSITLGRWCGDSSRVEGVGLELYKAYEEEGQRG